MISIDQKIACLREEFAPGIALADRTMILSNHKNSYLFLDWNMRNGLCLDSLQGLL